MRLIFLLVAMAAAIWQPGTLSAQPGGCSANCMMIRDPEGNRIGYGCVEVQGTNTSCIATSLRCSTQECKNVLLTDAQGRLLALADTCQDQIVIRAVPEVSVKSFGSAMQPPAPPRATVARAPAPAVVVMR